MSTKRLGSIVIAVFVMAMLLAISSVAAYSLTLDKTVNGLEDGVSYTAAQYDFASNSYGEFTELTSDTVLTSGVWGIKAGDADPEAIFVQGAESGRTSFWNESTNGIGNFFSSKKDTYVPGYWSINSDGAFSLLTNYNSGTVASVCIWVTKPKVLNPVQVQKTVNVEEVSYPVYSIDGAEYYLKEEAYYAVADNALYEGEGEATAVNVNKWTGSTPIIGEDNRLQESQYWYGFANNQVFPASAFDSYKSMTFAPKVGALGYNTGYSASDFDPKVIIYTKKIGSETVNEYVANTVFDTTITVTLPDSVPADEYVVAMSFLPYNGLPDDFFVNGGTNGGNEELNGYYHHYQKLSVDNGVTLTSPVFEAPTGLTGGTKTVVGLEEGKHYQIANVYLNEAGDGYTLGEWKTLTSETTDLAGLAVVRYCSEDGSVGSLPSNIIYISGDVDKRKQLSVLNDSGKITTASGKSIFTPGVWTGLSCGVYEQATGAYAVLDQVFGSCTDSQTLWLYQKTELEAEALLESHKSNTYASWTGGLDASLMQKIIDDFYASKADHTAAQLEAEKVALQEKIATALEKRHFKYAYEETEIIPAVYLNGFDLSIRKRQGSYTLTAKAVIVFKVMDLEGNVTDYTWTAPSQKYTNTSWLKFHVDTTELFPEDVYLVGFELYPLGKIDASSIVSEDGNLLGAKLVNARFIQNQWQAGYFYDSYDVKDYYYSAPEGITGGFATVNGLVEGKTYQYSQLELSSDGESLVYGEWKDYTEDIIPAGIVSFREVVSEGRVSVATDPIFVYGSHADREALCGIDPATGKIYAEAGSGFVSGYWTGASAATYSTFPTYGVSTLGAGWVLSGNIKAVHTAEAALAELEAAETPDEEAIALAKAAVLEKRKAIVAKCTDNWIYYGFEADEIVPVSQLNTFKFSSSVRQGVTYKEAYTSKVQVHIAGLDKKVKAYEYIVPAAKDGADRIIDFTDATLWTPNLPSEGYVVGIKIAQWSGKTNPDAWNLSNELNTMPMFTFYPEAYSIDFPEDMPRYATPDLYVEDGVIKGFDADLSYEYATANANGVSTYTALAEGTTEFTPANIGLWLFKAVGDNLKKADSKAKVILLPGENQSDILHTTSAVGTGGKYKGQTVDVINLYNINGFTEENYSTVKFNEKLWTGIYVNNTLCLEYGYDPLNLGGTGCTVSTGSLMKARDALAALLADETATAEDIAAAEQKFEEEKEKVVDLTTKVWYSYMYGADEIIPMSEFVSHTVKPWARQSAVLVESGTFYTKYVLKVISEDGVLEDRVAYKKNTYDNGASGGLVQTYTLSDFEKTDGYIVGIVVYPYGMSDNVKLKWNSTYPNTAVTADINLTLYKDGYAIKEPAAAPDITIKASEEGVDVVINNYIEGAQYVYSTDNKNWKNAPLGEYVFNVTEDAETLYIKVLEGSTYYESEVAEVTIPKFQVVPNLQLGEGNVISVEAGLYEIAQYAFNTELVYEPLTEKTLTAGVWAVRAVASETAFASAPQVFYIRGDEAGTVNYVGAKSADFIEGKWTMSSYSTTYAPSVSWETAGNIQFHLSGPYALAARRSFSAKYLYTADEIVPVTNLSDISVSPCDAFYHGYVLDGHTKSDGEGARAISTNGQTLARVYVVGAKVPYYDIITEVTYKNGFNFAISEYLADKEGYVIALELFPLWSVYGADNKTDLGDECVTALWLKSMTSTLKWSDYTFKLRFANQFVENELPAGESLPTTNSGTGVYADGTNRFAIRLEKVEPETPVISTNIKGDITVDNYVSIFTYVYSDDNGESWTKLTSQTFRAPKASTKYLIKVAESGNSFESEAVEVTSPAVTVAGISLVLDGTIGTRLYLDIDTETVDINKVTFHTTRANSDNGERKYCYTNIAGGNEWLSKIAYDEAKGLYYLTVSTAAKDTDNITYETELVYFVDGTKVTFGSINSNLSVATYTKTAKALAAEGNETFVEALPLIEALETYVKYADAYLNEKTVDAYKSDATITAVAPSKAGSLAGAEFYGSSLVLEDQVTIRHYFTVTDETAFVGGHTGTKNGMVYFDITDIPAQDIGKVYTLTVGDYTVSYSAANYLEEVANGEDAGLANLANAMYDYYLAAADYIK